VTLSFSASKKNAGQRNLLFGHIDRPEVKFEKMKEKIKKTGRIFILINPLEFQDNPSNYLGEK
jgi:hypothetical protein